MAILDLFRPQWKHSNPQARAAALRHLEDDRQEIFVLAALDDDDAGLRLTAAKRVGGEENLRKILAQSADKPVQDVARKSLARRVADKALRAGASAPEAEIRGWVEELRGTPGGDKLLEEVALRAPSPEARRTALGALTHAASFLAVALEEPSDAIALEALKRLDRANHLQSVAKSARSRAVREAAREKLKDLDAAKKPDDAALNRAKLNILLGAAERAEAESADAGRASWELLRERVDEAEHALGELLAGGVVPAESLARFQGHAGAFRARYARHQEVEAERTQRDVRERRDRETREDACARMEALYADAGAVDADEVGTLTRRFNAAGSPEDRTLDERFRIARDRVVREKLQKQREEEEAEKHRQDSQSARERLEAMAHEAEGLKGQTSDPGRIAERLAALRGDWERVFSRAGAFDAKDDLAARFGNAIAGLEAFVETARREVGATLEKWIAELEAFAGAADLKAAERRLKETQARWKGLLSLAAEGGDALALRYHAAADRLRETLDWNRWANLQRKQDLCTQLEALATGEDRKAMAARFRELTAEWKIVGPVPWDDTEALWDRYHAVCDGLYEKLREYFAELGEEREGNLKIKEEICGRLEALLAQGEIDWREATEAFKEAHSSWKAVGAVPREKSDALWDRFRAASKAFYDRKDGQYHDNLVRKRELAALAEGLKDSTEWKKAAAQIKEAQEKWKAIGPMPRDKAEALWNRFHGACEAFFQARKAHFDRLDAERPLNLEKKLALCELVETLNALPDDKDRHARILDAQSRWKEIGPVPREQEDALWERFRKPIDAYFQERRGKLEGERGQREENVKVKEDLCAEAESLRDSTDWKETVERIKALQAEWKATGPVPRQLDQELWQRFRGACDAFFDRLKENSALRDRERDGNLRKKEDICFTLEILSGRVPEDADDRSARDAWIEAQASAGLPATEAMSNWNKAGECVKHFQLEWRKIGPVPRERNDAVWERFQRACDVLYEEYRRSQGMAADDPQANLESKLGLIADAEELERDPGPHREAAVQDLRRRWKRVGPVPRAQSDYVWDRFNAACDGAVGK